MQQITKVQSVQRLYFSYKQGTPLINQVSDKNKAQITGQTISKQKELCMILMIVPNFIHFLILIWPNSQLLHKLIKMVSQGTYHIQWQLKQGKFTLWKALYNKRKLLQESTEILPQEKRRQLKNIWNLIQEQNLLPTQFFSMCQRQSSTFHPYIKLIQKPISS